MFRRLRKTGAAKRNTCWDTGGVDSADEPGRKKPMAIISDEAFERPVVSVW